MLDGRRLGGGGGGGGEGKGGAYYWIFSQTVASYDNACGW